MDVLHSWAIATSPMRSALEDVIAQRQLRRERHKYCASADSRAMAELAATRPLQAYVGTPTEDAVNFADQLLIAAEDHFGAICRLVEHEAPVLYADKVLARAGIEACGRAVWLLDPSLDSEARAARGLTQRFATIKANAELLKGSGEGAQFCRDRRDELISQCVAAAIHPTRYDGTAFVRDRIPSERQVMRNLFSVDVGDDIDLGSFSQTWLSRFVHSDSAGLMEDMLDPPPSDDRVSAPPGVMMKGLASSSDRVNILMALCTAAHLIAAGMFLRHEGWFDADWTRAVVNVRGLVRRTISGEPAA